jgi:hypothetical protein
MNGTKKFQQDLVSDLCKLAGFETGVRNLGNVCLLNALLWIARPDGEEPPREQGRQMVEFLTVEIEDVNSEIRLQRGDLLSAFQVREILTMAFDLLGTGWGSEDRRLACIRIARPQGRCGLESWRSKGRNLKTGIEAEILHHFALYLLDNYPERAEGYEVA